MAQVERLHAVIAALRRKRKQHAAGFSRGLKIAGLYLQRESQKLAPVDTGAMRNSAFTRAEGSGFDTVVTVGYTQAYSVYVHENLTARHAYPTQAKFLEQPAREKRKEIAKIVRNEAARKK